MIPELDWGGRWEGGGDGCGGGWVGVSNVVVLGGGEVCTWRCLLLFTVEYAVTVLVVGGEGWSVSRPLDVDVP